MMRIKAIWTITIFFMMIGAVIDAVGADRKKAVELNSIGYKYYSEKRYYAAIKEFRKAIMEDETYVYPHYNLACSISLLFEINDFIEYEEENAPLEPVDRILLIAEALSNLEKAVQLNPEYMKKARTDKDLTYMGKYAPFYQILGYNLNEAEDVQKMLYGVMSLSGVTIIPHF
jgi:tetratricopeptide (TPR) repeat protein